MFKTCFLITVIGHKWGPKLRDYGCRYVRRMAFGSLAMLMILYWLSLCVCAHSGLVLRLQYFVSRELAAEAMFTVRRQFLNWPSGRILLENLYKTASKILSPFLFKLHNSPRQQTKLKTYTITTFLQYIKDYGNALQKRSICWYLLMREVNNEHFYSIY